jgi:hypothetical protein
MKRFVLNGSKCTDGCFTTAFFQKEHASLSVRCGAVAAQRLAVAMNTKEQTCLRARAAKQPHCTATSLRLPFQAIAHITDLDFKYFDSERLITEVEKRPALYNLFID